MQKGFRNLLFFRFPKPLSGVNVCLLKYLSFLRYLNPLKYLSLLSLLSYHQFAAADYLAEVLVEYIEIYSVVPWQAEYITFSIRADVVE